MGKGKKAGDKAAKASNKAKQVKTPEVAKLPKKKCCESKSKCGRCPLRMLKEGTLPDGYTVHRRKLVKVSGLPSGDGKKPKAA